MTAQALPTALAMARRGWAVFPVNGKRPRTASGVKDATTAEDQIRAWWNEWPEAGVAVATGSESGLWVLDVDGEEGIDDLTALELEHGDLPETIGCRTRRGRHYYFRLNGQRIRNSAGRVAPGLDVRAEGGYVVAPPSQHPDGGAYTWDPSPRDADVCDAPGWLLELVTAPESSQTPTVESVGDKFPEGTRNASLASLAGSMRRRGMGPGAIYAALAEENRTRCSPPLPEEEVRLIADSVSRYEPAPDTHATHVPNEPNGEGVTLDDFWAFMPQHRYIFTPTRETWPGASVSARIPPVELLDAQGNPILDDNGEPKTIPANKWLDENQPVEQMTWSPGEPMLIEDRLISGGGWIERPGCRTFNLYRPPTITYGDPDEAGPWVDHIRRVFPDSAEHIVQYFAHRIQRPQEKLNHALVLIGAQGTGKDTVVQGVVPAVGPWNVAEASPDQLMGRFNSFIKSVILRVSEARDLGDTDRYRLYEHLKTLIAAPPDVLRCDEKHLREYAVPNVCAVVITSNHTDGIYLPPDDRRHYVALTELTKEDFEPAYWDGIYRWYEDGAGYRHVAAYLAGLDLAGFDPKAPPPKTDAFWRVVDAGRAPEDAELCDVLEKLEWPPAVTLKELGDLAEPSFGDWLRDRRNTRQIPHRMESVGYISVRNDSTKDGRWKVGGKNQVIYARRELSIRNRIAAARALAEGAR